MNFVQQVDLLVLAFQTRRNVLLVGKRGVGKTASVFAMADQLGVNLASFCAATTDPLSHLTGVPYPVIGGERPELLFLRPDALQSASVLLFDDVNRSGNQVMDAIMELMLNRSINGEKLPNLASVMCAMNPPEPGYHVFDMDLAVEDRFHLIVEVKGTPDRGYFVGQFGEELGAALVDWRQNDLNEIQRDEVSLRRLEFIGQAIRDKIDPCYTLKPDTTVPLHLLKKRLNGPGAALDARHFLSNPIKYKGLVQCDLNVITKFLGSVRTMEASDLVLVRNLIEDLLEEELAALHRQGPDLIKKCYLAVRENLGQAEARAFLRKAARKLGKPMKSLLE